MFLHWGDINENESYAETRAPFFLLLVLFFFFVIPRDQITFYRYRCLSAAKQCVRAGRIINDTHKSDFVLLSCSEIKFARVILQFNALTSKSFRCDLFCANTHYTGVIKFLSFPSFFTNVTSLHFTMRTRCVLQYK